jgi:hypothetical protein
MCKSRANASLVREACIRAEDGKSYTIDVRAMSAAMERTQTYLEGALRWSVELAAHMERGAEEPDTRAHDQFLELNHIPKEVWFPLDNPFAQTDLMNVMAMLHYWIEGTLEDFEAQYAWLEGELDLDPTYIFYGVPISLLSVQSQQELHKIGAAFAQRSTTTAARLN